MLRAILSVIAAVVAWMLIATAGNLALRFSWPGYAAAEPAMAFTLPMLLARLVLAALASLGAGWVGGWISRGSRTIIGVVAAILLIFFIPVHYRLWEAFPLWYHATFLISLVVLTVVGGTLYRPLKLQGDPRAADRSTAR